MGGDWPFLKADDGDLKYWIKLTRIALFLLSHWLKCLVAEKVAYRDAGLKAVGTGQCHDCRKAIEGSRIRFR